MYNSKLHFHFTGVGGAGMSGLAEILRNLGFVVSGSDIKRSATTERLERLGVQLFLGHAPEHLPAEASLLVYSSAVGADNPEYQEAKRRGIPVIRRAEVLAELMRLKFGVAVAGSHGKTTTTSMTAAIMEQGGLDPTVIIGGQVKAMNSGSRLGRGQYLVAESDESDRSFLLLRPTVAVVTNIDAEHLSAYSSLADLEESFAAFVRSVPFYGLAVLCLDDTRVRVLAEQYQGRKVTYGLSLDADIRAEEIVVGRNGTTFTVLRGGERLMRLTLPMIGRHLAINALASIAVGLEFGVPTEAIVRAIEGFSGVKRRLEILAEARGVTVMSDYGHHPTEIKATIAAVRQAWGAELGRLIVLFQPHRYSRTKDCFVMFLDAFNEADEVYLGEIYSAGEEPIAGVSGAALAQALSHPRVTFAPDLGLIPPALAPTLGTGDVVLFLGAGTVGSLAEGFAEEWLARSSTVTVANE